MCKEVDNTPQASKNPVTKDDDKPISTQVPEIINEEVKIYRESPDPTWIQPESPASKSLSVAIGINNKSLLMNISSDDGMSSASDVLENICPIDNESSFDEQLDKLPFPSA